MLLTERTLRGWDIEPTAGVLLKLVFAANEWPLVPFRVT